MVPNRSLLVPPASGFVPFSGGALSDDVLEHAPPAHALRRRPPEVEDLVEGAADALPEAVSHAARPGMRQVQWQPKTTVAVRRVEFGVLAAICGYFTFGLGKLLGVF
jgi:hypothetical protein